MSDISKRLHPRQPVPEDMRLKNSQPLTEDPPTREHPLWPAFMTWAHEHLAPNIMLISYWECWLAAVEAKEKQVTDGMAEALKQET
jgi:hypothetical protein